MMGAPPALCHAILKAARPLPAVYPADLKSVGNHIRTRRRDLKLLQRHVAERIGVDEGMVWALGDKKSQLAPRLVQKVRVAGCRRP